MNKKQTWLCMALVAVGVSVGVSLAVRRGESTQAWVARGWTQEAYVWQRHWTPQVTKAVRETGGEKGLSGLCVLAGELRWRGDEPQMMEPKIDWEALTIGGGEIRLAWRLPWFSGKPAWDDRVRAVVGESIDRVMKKAAEVGIRVAEVQLDYDCPTRLLKEYAQEVLRLRKGRDRDGVVWTATALPAWLEAAGMRELVKAVDGLVLQVHWLHRRLDDLGQGQLVDEAAAKRAVQKCEELKVPFRVALPTYGNGVWVDDEGRWLDVVAEEEEKVMPPNLQVEEVKSDPVLMQKLAREWQEQRPAFLTGVMWYRLPVEGEVRNWQWKTFAAVLRGEGLATRFEVRVRRRGEGFDEVIVENAGNMDGVAPSEIVAEELGKILVSDGANGYSVKESDAGVVWKNAEPRMLRAGQSLNIGWWRSEGDLPNSDQVRLRVK